MVCPNCHSDDVITVQDQLFCVNCGRLLTKSEAASQTKTSRPKTVIKRGPGRPRAAKLDTPRPTPVRAVTATVASRQPIHAPEAIPGAATTRAKGKRVVHHSVIWAAVRALHPAWIALALPGAAVVAGAVTLAVGAWLYLPRHDQAEQFVAALCLGFGGVVWLRFIRSAVMFQRAGAHDHRLMKIETALRVAMARTGRLALFNLRHCAAALAELAALAIVVWYGGRITHLPEIVHVGLLFLVCFGLVYLICSLWVVQRLVEAGIVISDLKLPTAHWLGWKLWRRHWELLGARFGALLLILTSAGGAAVGLKAGLGQLSYTTRFSVDFVVATIAMAALTVVSGGAAEASYRQLVNLSQPQRAGQLMGRRRAQAPSPGSVILFLAGLILPLVAVGLVVTLWHVRGSGPSQQSG